MHAAVDAAMIVAELHGVATAARVAVEKLVASAHSEISTRTANQSFCRFHPVLCPPPSPAIPDLEPSPLQPLSPTRLPTLLLEQAPYAYRGWWFEPGAEQKRAHRRRTQGDDGVHAGSCVHRQMPQP